MVDVITIGSATIDVFMRVEEDLTKLKLGEKVLVDYLDIETGGGGTNSAVALSRMGLKVKYLGRLGKDEFAEMVKNNLNSENVEVIRTKPDKKLAACQYVCQLDI